MPHVIRQATPADNDALIQLERRSPLGLGDRFLTFDRTPNFFAHQEMQPHGRVFVAEEDGTLLGVVAGAWHNVLVEGKRRRLIYIHQGRMAPEHRRRRVASQLVMWNMAAAKNERVQSAYWLISPDNKTSMGFGARMADSIWPLNGRIDGFPVTARRPAAPPVGAVTERDIPRIVELINRTHTGRELFLPYTTHYLRSRLKLSPTYSLRDWRACRAGSTLAAAAGMWDYACSLKMTDRDKTTGDKKTSLPAYVLDYGYAEGAEEAMVEVLMALMEMAAQRGRTELWLCLPVEERIYSLLEELPHTTTVFCIITPGFPRPARIERSVYLDPVYV